MNRARHKHAAVPVAGGVLVVGGSSAQDFQGRYASAELYNAKRRTWTRIAPMTEARFKITAAVTPLARGAALVAGGGRIVERYDPQQRRFTAAGRIGSVLAFSTATRLRSGEVLIVGGYDDRIDVTNRAWLYRAG